MEKRWEAYRTNTFFLGLRRFNYWTHCIRVRTLTGMSFLETPIKCIGKIWAVRTSKCITLSLYPSELEILYQMTRPSP